MSTKIKAAQECKHCDRPATWQWSDDDSNESSSICMNCMDTVGSYRFAPLRQFTLLKAGTGERYFAIVIQGDDSLGDVLTASTELGNYLRRYESDLLPPGCKITRSIEISKQKATETWL